MPLNIRTEEAEAPASELARLTGETKADALTEALRERLAQVHRARAKGRVAADELDKIALHCAASPVLDQRSAHKTVGYDANGLPD
jgi:antitoxin VapB